MNQLTSSTGLTITNPLVLYRTLLAIKRIDPDPAQHRLALHLQKLYYRLKDYQPELDFGHRLDQLNDLVKKDSSTLASKQASDARRISADRKGIFSPFQRQKEKTDITALARRLTNHESAIQMQSPQGLLLYGEVGTGKSLLVDMLAESLPSNKKRRWHFNTFMLEMFARLEQLRKNRMNVPSSLTTDSIQKNEEHSLLQLARDMISTSPILFLDEFQLPDRATSKILSNLLTSFFHLGGVLIATSNRMPEELANASGVEFAAPPSNKLGLLGSKWSILKNKNQGKDNETMLAGKGDFAAFLEVLRARCEIWDMEGGKDWRRREVEQQTDVDVVSREAETGALREFEGLEPMLVGNLGLGYEQSLHVKSQAPQTPKRNTSKTVKPKFYFTGSLKTVSQSETEQAGKDWKMAELIAIYGSSQAQSLDTDIPWETATLRVYGRDLLVPCSLSGVTKWTFDELCSANLGPADYITIASTFHTLILTDVPILSLLEKNEARRFITLLDALYEARCKLLINAEAGPDDIFFPETKRDPASDGDQERVADQVYSETFSEIYQDQISPFRPNVSSYQPSASASSYAANPSSPRLSQAASARSILADEDSDFGPAYGAGRSHGPSDGVPGAGNEIGRQSGPDFSRTGAYTGEDERFAYKRARSRLWEMCGSRWWAREEEGWWKPLSKEIRRWEGSPTDPVTPIDENRTPKDGAIDEDNMGPVFKHGASPFRTSEEAPPKFGYQHAWGMMTWGKKAGAWGKGPEGLDDKRNKR